MKEVHETQKGNRCIAAILAEKPRTIIRVEFWDILHTHSSQKNICLMIGKYHKTNGSNRGKVETENPKSQVSLNREEFLNLLAFLQANYEPFKQGFNRFISLDGRFSQQSKDYLQAIVESPAKKDFLDFIANNDVLADELAPALQSRTRIRAVKEFEKMLTENLDEHAWQKWFKRNDWVFGSEFVQVLDERAIDIDNITDYLVHAYDGFLDIVEIKRPEGNVRFWSEKQFRGNYVQSHGLTEAITQAANYIYQLELQANNVESLERFDDIKTIKPRCTLIFGRSKRWNQAQRKAYRILNSSFHILTILTYDHVLDRAKKIAGMNEPKEAENNQINDSEAGAVPF